MAIHIEQSIWIGRGCDEVFAIAGDWRNDPRWREGVSELRVLEGGDLAIGKSTLEILDFLGSRYETTARITCFDPGRKTAFETTQGKVPANGYREFRPEGQGTRFTYVLEMRPGGFLAAFAPVLHALYDRRVKRDLLRLKSLLESP